MPHVKRGALRALAIAIAITTPPAAAPAHAEDPVTAAVELGEDTTALAVESALDVARGCTPIVTRWSPLPFNYAPFIRNNSTWYREVGGGIAHLNCTIPVRIQARLIDASAPPFLPYRGPVSPAYMTSKNPQDTGVVEAPYVGPDAPVLRPFGQITVRVEVFRKLSTGRYAKIYNGCNEWHYVISPPASLTVTDPTSQSACANGTYELFDAADMVSVEEVVEADSPEALAG